MFEKGDYIVYGSSGVCEVMDVGPMEMSGAQKGNLYYTLKQKYSEGGMIFTPVDNQKIVMRAVYTGKEAEELMETIPFIEPMDVKDERKREEVYKELLRSCDFTGYIRLIKLILWRRDRRVAAGKKMASLDERYLKLAEDALYGELEVSLSVDREDLKKEIEGRIISALTE